MACKEKCTCLLEFYSATDLSMEFLMKPVQVYHLFSKHDLELVYKLLTLMRMRPHEEKKHHVSPSSTCSDLTTGSMMLRIFFRASIPGVLLLLERFLLSLRTTILTFRPIKKISSLNVNYLGGKSLPICDLAHYFWGPHAWLLNTRDCQDCVNQNRNEDQRLEKSVGVTGLTWGNSKRRKNLKHPGQNCSLRQC